MKAGADRVSLSTGASSQKDADESANFWRSCGYDVKVNEYERSLDDDEWAAVIIGALSRCETADDVKAAKQEAIEWLRESIWA